MSIKEKVLSATGLAALMSTLGATSVDAKAAADAMVDLELSKAGEAQSLKPGEHVPDRWQTGEGHKVPGTEKLMTGPTQESSGAGAEKMIAHYSHPAPQSALTVEGETLARELGSLRGYAKGVGAAVEKLASGQQAMTGVLTTLLTKFAGEAEGGTPDEAARFAALHASKADQFWRASKSIIAKASQISDSLDDLEGDARKAAKAQLRDLKQQAVRLVHKALAAAYAAKGDENPAAEVIKSIHTMLDGDPAFKAGFESFRDKDEKKDEEKRAKKFMKKAVKKAVKKITAKAAKKAAAGTEGQKAAAATAPVGEGAGEAGKSNQAAKQDPDTKNQDDAAAAKKAAEDIAVEAVKNALTGVGMLEGKMDQIIAIVQGRPLTNKASEPLVLAKADNAGTLISLAQKIDDASNDGRLDPGGEMKARDLLQKLTYVRDGGMSKDMWKTMHNQSPPSVQEIFAEAA